MTNQRTEVEKLTRYMIATDVLARPLESLGKKGTRRLDKTAKNIADLIRAEGDLGNSIYAKIEEKEEELKARTMNEGIDAFCKKYPTHGKILNGFIEEKRVARNSYLVYGLNEGYKLGEEDYLKIMTDLGFDKREASSMYPHIIAVSERLGKAGEYNERSILLKDQKKKK
jgi:hypothetical protein